MISSKTRLQERVERLLTAIEEANRAEDEAYGDRDLEELGGSAELNAERLQETISYRSQNGYLSERRIYACHHCADCPLKPSCTQAHGNRRIKVSLALRRYRQQARDNLLSEHGSRLRKQRGTVLEGSFGNIKHNLGFRRFHLRGLVKVEIALGLICLAHNIRKLGQLKSKGN